MRDTPGTNSGFLPLIVKYFRKQKNYVFNCTICYEKLNFPWKEEKKFPIKIVTIYFLSTIVFSNDNKCVFVLYKMCTKKQHSSMPEKKKNMLFANEG